MLFFFLFKLLHPQPPPQKVGWEGGSEYSLRLGGGRAHHLPTMAFTWLQTCHCTRDPNFNHHRQATHPPPRHTSLRVLQKAGSHHDLTLGT